MYQPRGRVLLGVVTLLTSLGFLLIGFDNGLMGGIGKFFAPFKELDDLGQLSQISNSRCFQRYLSHARLRYFGPHHRQFRK
jgi:hypothetical protein